MTILWHRKCKINRKEEEIFRQKEKSSCCSFQASAREANHLSGKGGSRLKSQARISKILNLKIKFSHIEN